jgi:tetratricopeptide (TPR) repeat protein
MTIDQALQIAVEHHQAGRLAEAEAIYRQVLTQFPDHADALHLLGLLAAQTGHADAAIDLIGRAIALKPGVAQAHNNLGLALCALGRRDEALAVYAQAIALAPGDAEIHANRVVALHASGRLEEAIAAYRQAIALGPDRAAAQSNLGAALHARAMPGPTATSAACCASRAGSTSPSPPSARPSSSIPGWPWHTRTWASPWRIKARSPWRSPPTAGRSNWSPDSPGLIAASCTR